MRQKIMDLCWEIEKLPASEQQTEISLMASALLADLDAAVANAVLDHDQAWQDIATHLGGLCLGGVDVKANQQQICDAIDAAILAERDRCAGVCRELMHQVCFGTEMVEHNKTLYLAEQKIKEGV